MLKVADLVQRWMKGVSGAFALKKLWEQPQPSNTMKGPNQPLGLQPALFTTHGSGGE